MKNWMEISEKFRVEGALYKKAKASLRLGDIPNCLDYITRYFFLRNKRKLTSKGEVFFRIQFALYLLGKEKMDFSNMEGDMIAVYIMDSYEEIEIDLKNSPISPNENFVSWCSTVSLDFPFFYQFSEDKKDQEIKDFGSECIKMKLC
ncbi:MAG: hypothetical protein WC162_05265 [Sphaerochaetaceae bacterium]|nr:hypothetical protein [Sphaerochaetaceae bacterium]